MEEVLPERGKGACGGGEGKAVVVDDEAEEEREAEMEEEEDEEAIDKEEEAEAEAKEALKDVDDCNADDDGERGYAGESGDRGTADTISLALPVSVSRGVESIGVSQDAAPQPSGGSCWWWKPSCRCRRTTRNNRYLKSAQKHLARLGASTAFKE